MLSFKVQQSLRVEGRKYRGFLVIDGGGCAVSERQGLSPNKQASNKSKRERETETERQTNGL